jgi:hypothetical protein
LHSGPPKINIDNDQIAPSTHTYLPLFEDGVSIQSAISDVCEMMLHRRIETKEASILLYALQVASTNMAHLNAVKNQPKRHSKRKDPDSGPDPDPDSNSGGALSSREASTADSDASPSGQ